MQGSALFMLSEIITRQSRRSFKSKYINTWLVLHIPPIIALSFCGVIEPFWPMNCLIPSSAWALILEAITSCTEERSSHARLVIMLPTLLGCITHRHLEENIKGKQVIAVTWPPIIHLILELTSSRFTI